MTKKEAKEKAQDILMHALQSSYYYLEDDNSVSQEEKESIREAMNKQFERIEKLLGYVPGSYIKGG